MGLIRLIIFALVIWLIWRLVTNFKGKLARNQEQKAKIENQHMVACHYCSVHIPEEDALQHADNWFCSDAHKEKYLAEKS